MKNTIAVLLLFLSVTAKAQVSIGSPAPEISLPNAKDSIVNLSSFKGKVLLIDFWASWCGPCRQANPRVVKLYNKYRAQGFEVLGISVDKEKKLWLKAVKKDKLTYTQVNDNNYGQSIVSDKYAVYEIPTSFLINKEGIVVAVNLEGKELEEKIKELLQ
jgi:peroxiredoxin